MGSLGKLFSRRRLLLMLVLLLLAVFVVKPLLLWQTTSLLQLHAKQVQLKKIEYLMTNEGQLAARSADLTQASDDVKEYFYANKDDLKLRIQSDVEAIFLSNDLTIDGLNWLADSGAPMRRLRVQLRFNGDSDDVMTAFWDVAKHPKLLHIVEWQQRFDGLDGASFGSADGSVVFEIIALTDTIAGVSRDEIAQVRPTKSQNQAFAIAGATGTAHE